MNPLCPQSDTGRAPPDLPPRAPASDKTKTAG